MVATEERDVFGVVDFEVVEIDKDFYGEVAAVYVKARKIIAKMGWIG